MLGSIAKRKQVPVGTTMRPDCGLVEEEEEVWWRVLVVPMKLGDVLYNDYKFTDKRKLVTDRPTDGHPHIEMRGRI